MGDAIEGMDTGVEQKDFEKRIFENKRGLPDSEVIEQMNKRGLNNLSSNRKSDMIKDRIKNSLNIHKYDTNKNQQN